MSWTVYRCHWEKLIYLGRKHLQTLWAIWFHPVTDIYEEDGILLLGWQ